MPLLHLLFSLFDRLLSTDSEESRSRFLLELRNLLSRRNPGWLPEHLASTTSALQLYLENLSSGHQEVFASYLIHYLESAKKRDIEVEQTSVTSIGEIIGSFSIDTTNVADKLFELAILNLTSSPIENSNTIANVIAATSSESTAMSESLKAALSNSSDMINVAVFIALHNNALAPQIDPLYQSIPASIIRERITSSEDHAKSIRENIRSLMNISTFDRRAALSTTYAEWTPHLPIIFLEATASKISELAAIGDQLTDQESYQPFRHSYTTLEKIFAVTCRDRTKLQDASILTRMRLSQWEKNPRLSMKIYQSLKINCLSGIRGTPIANLCESDEKSERALIGTIRSF